MLNQRVLVITTTVKRLSVEQMFGEPEGITFRELTRAQTGGGGARG